jgi:hypothetical protein
VLSPSLGQAIHPLSLRKVKELEMEKAKGNEKQIEKELGTPRKPPMIENVVVVNFIDWKVVD